MKTAVVIGLCITGSMLLLSPKTQAEETHAASIIASIMQTRQAILAGAGESSSDNFIFVTFWDFDGTILKGDCTEGLTDGDQTLYKGLAQLAIESGYSDIYRPEGGVAQFKQDYRHMEHHVGAWLAYPFVPQMLRGAALSDIHAMSVNHFNNVLSHYYYSSSIRMLNTLEASGIRCYILSASADCFVEAAAETLGLSAERFYGIEVRAREGRLTEELIYPVPWAEGKREKLISIVDEIALLHPNKQVIVLAAFGNSYGTDGPFMKYVVMQELPVERPVAVMINGGNTPAPYRDLFIRVQQSDVQSSVIQEKPSLGSEAGAEGDAAELVP